MSSPQPPSDSDDERSAPGSPSPSWSAGPPEPADAPDPGEPAEHQEPADTPEPSGTGAPGANWPPTAEGWAAPPPPAPGDGYSPPPHMGSYAGQAPQYPPPGYPPQGYQAVGYPAPGQTDSKAIIALVLAISSWLVCPILPAIVALVLAAQSNRAIDEAGGRLEGRSLNTATKVVAWLNIALLGLVIAGALLLVVIGIITSSSIPDGSTQF